GGLELAELEALREQRLGHGVPAGGRVAAAELRGGRGVEVAFGQIIPRGLRLRGLQLRLVELRRGRVGRDQPGARAAVALDRGAAALVVDPVADAIGELLDGLYEADVFLLLQEAVDV